MPREDKPHPLFANTGLLVLATDGINNYIVAITSLSVVKLERILYNAN